MAKRIKKDDSSKVVPKIANVKKSKKKIGHYAFIIGIIATVLAGLFVDPVVSPERIVRFVVSVILILGIFIGVLNITHKETVGFLIAAISLMLVGTANLTIIGWGIGSALQAILYFIRILVAPAVLIVALKTIKNLAEN